MHERLENIFWKRQTTEYFRSFCFFEKVARIAEIVCFIIKNGLSG